MTKKITIALLLLSISFLFAIDSGRFAVGAHVGFSTSNGISARIGNRNFIVQPTFFAYQKDNTLGPKEYDIWAGLNFMMVLKEFPSSRFFIMAGGSYRSRYLFDSWDDEYTDKVSTIFGIGPGVEYLFSKNMPELRGSLEICLYSRQGNRDVIGYPSAGIYYYFH